MKFCRFVPKSAGVPSRVLPSYGLIEGQIIHGISAPPWLKWSREEASLPMREARLLAPVEPSKIVCVGRNYAAHA
jgi:2-keto-4-pentenoate hydratase/2-oxohepta-3-ene-1,7-dioic acid hydratase in catechol pathway